MKMITPYFRLSDDCEVFGGFSLSFLPALLFLAHLTVPSFKWQLEPPSWHCLGKGRGLQKNKRGFEYQKSRARRYPRMGDDALGFLAFAVTWDVYRRHRIVVYMRKP